MSQKTALVIILDGVEELEAIAPVDLLRRAEVDVTVAAAGPGLGVTGRDRIRIEADTLLANVQDATFDLVVIPGGPGHASLLENQAVIEILQAQQRRGGLVGSICAGPLVLKKAGLLDGRRYTSFPGTADKLPDRDPDASVVIDGNLITSQGAGTAIQFALALIGGLAGHEKAREIAEAICFKG
jgi:4-methyl-5(b-hydroxyethyl)-thiazole monophosphate biosynthesis